ncbi:hemicentin-1-like isoform X1 [Triplophysa dalaica]|uniref:hemicentin-1-like isoform X1 n=1 Tax=Triplophysa dalaica TaxID=1582913 RepID=UPI0024DF7A44|nr:hemicentin-1-like isoform X1 [Triplophysa dalaica]
MCLEFVLCCLFFTGVFGDAGEVTVSVMEGDSLTLHTEDTEIKRHVTIKWKYGPREMVIAEVNGRVPSFSTYDGDHERFKDRLKLDYETGDLTITDIRPDHSGLYKLQVISNRVSYKKYIVTVYASLPVPVISRDSSQCLSPERTSVSNCSVLCSVMNVSHGVSLSWYKEKSLLSSINVSDLNIRLSLPLEVEYQDTNTYRCVINNPITNITQHLDINQLCHPKSACLPVPVISRDSSQCSSSSVSNCSLSCSVLNVTDVSLSWYKGNRLLSSISVSDLNIRLSLPLEVEYQDANTYSCVVNNSVTSQTQHVGPDVCRPCSGRVHCCGFTEIVIRLVISSLVVVATVAVLVYDVRSSGDGQKKSRSHQSNAVESHALTLVLEINAQESH